jgi:hypothetical protein
LRHERREMNSDVCVPRILSFQGKDAMRKLLTSAIVLALLAPFAHAQSITPQIGGGIGQFDGGISRKAKGVFSPCNGGTRTTSGGNTIITFTSSGSLVCAASFAAQVLVVAGGAGASSGGGGAGGYCITVGTPTCGLVDGI